MIGCVKPCATSALMRRRIRPVSSGGRFSALRFPLRYRSELFAPRASTTGSEDSNTQSTRCRTAKEVALAYYENYNSKRIDGILELLAEDCVYEDLVYQEPFVGRDAIAAYLRKVEAMVPSDVRFVVEDITDGDPRRVGVRWHVELEGGVVLPFSRGTSFYQLNDQGQIIFARDIVEPSIKPGSAALRGIALVAPLVRKLGPRADPAMLSKLPIASWLMFAGWGVYLIVVLLSRIPPGVPAWETSPQALDTILHESFNFFYVNFAMAKLGINFVPCISEHPVSEAVFNFVSAWSLLFLPTILTDPKGRNIPKNQKLFIWIGIMFVTNVFFPLYMALRLLPSTSSGGDDGLSSKQASTNTREALKLPSYAPLIGGLSLGVGILSVVWGLVAHPEIADGLQQRYHYFLSQFHSERIFWAFCLDILLYYVWQVWLLGDNVTAKPWHTWTPFVGMAAWLLQPSQPNKN